MASTSETGHAKNVATFEGIISFAKGLGAKYNPAKDSLKIAALESLHKNAKEALNATKTAQATFNNATNKRAATFKSLNIFSTRLMATASVFLPKEAVADLKTINRKIQGTRATQPAEKPANGQPAPNDKNISTAQLSYDSLLDHFEKITETLNSHPDYKPNEPELTINGLKAKLTEMRQANSNVIDAYTGWSNARIQRDDVIYNALTGLVAAAADVKNYIKGAFGFKSPQYKQVSGIQFSKP